MSPLGSLGFITALIDDALTAETAALRERAEMHAELAGTAPLAVF